MTNDITAERLEIAYLYDQLDLQLDRLQTLRAKFVTVPLSLMLTFLGGTVFGWYLSGMQHLWPLFLDFQNYCR